MPIATDYPFLDAVWTIMVFIAWVAYLWLLVVIFGDLFRRRDIGGWAKAAWVVFMIVLPFIGVLSYLIVQHDGMAQRNVERVEQTQAQMDAYVKSVAAHNGAASEIERAKKLLDSGTISQPEFDSIKAKALAAH
jgi:hypothetical protein